MEKTRLYLPAEDYYNDVLFTYINKELSKIFEEIRLEMKNYGPDSWKSEGFAKLITDNSENSASTPSNRKLDFKFDYLKKDVFFSESSLFGLILHYPSSKPFVDLTPFLEELADSYYALEAYEVIQIEDADEFVELFKELKHDLISELIAYIKSDFYMKISEGLVKDEKVYSAIYEH